MVKILPYLQIANGKEAIEHYKALFGAELIEHQPFSKEIGKEFGFPEDFDYDNSTMHAELKIEEASFYLSDNTNPPQEQTGNVEIVLDLDSKEKIDSIYSRVQEFDLKIKMELQKTFWGAYYTRFEDKFGIGWQMNFTEPK
ncbi:MAG: VOC family protein [Candidatus Hodarchaeales archaeon]|jgi:PhnB protein